VHRSVGLVPVEPTVQRPVWTMRRRQANWCRNSVPRRCRGCGTWRTRGGSGCARLEPW